VIPAVRPEEVSYEERCIRSLIYTWLKDNAPGVEHARHRALLLEAIHEAGRQERKAGRPQQFLEDLGDRAMRDICDRMLEYGMPILATLDGYFYGGGTGNYFRDLLAFCRMVIPKIKALSRKMKMAQFALEEEHRRKSWKPVGHQRDLGIIVEAGKQ